MNRLAVSVIVSLLLLAQAGLVEASPASTGYPACSARDP